MTEAEITVRPADSGDREPLATFTCATGPSWEYEVEDYVRTRVIDDLAEVNLYEARVAEQEDRIIACMAWLPELLPVNTGQIVLGSRLQVVAIATSHQGHILPSGRRLSDALIQTAMAQCLAPTGSGLITAIAAADNIRSIKLCERNGLTSQIRHGADHVRLTGAFGDVDGWVS